MVPQSVQRLRATSFGCLQFSQVQVVRSMVSLMVVLPARRGCAGVDVPADQEHLSARRVLEARQRP